MEPVEWPDELTTGMHEIDAQHRLVLDLCNRVLEALWSKQSQQKVLGIMQSCLLVVKYHLDCEERYMVDFEWSGIEEHRADHTKLLMGMAKIEQSLYADGAGWRLNMEALNGLKEWFSEHIAKFDMPLALRILGREADAA